MLVIQLVLVLLRLVLMDYRPKFVPNVLVLTFGSSRPLVLPLIGYHHLTLAILRYLELILH